MFKVKNIILRYKKERVHCFPISNDLHGLWMRSCQKLWKMFLIQFQPQWTAGNIWIGSCPFSANQLFSPAVIVFTALRSKSSNQLTYNNTEISVVLSFNLSVLQLLENTRPRIVQCALHTKNCNVEEDCYDFKLSIEADPRFREHIAASCRA